ncbi:hypothetical protein NP493_278g03094 [Ridgeia piscesae]|uniref:DUF4806 domain-containing protein n=1 Tax=Ridgeia piscesae TaxID=27915 RepID=A0AAD9UCG4_RIDPI|nr:hypothetical protein NP493_278g03094 [Ridgeia piscesae]
MKIDKAVRSGMEPDSSFQAHECRVLYTSSFYDKARKKLQQAEMTSDLATEAEEETPKKDKKATAHPDGITSTTSEFIAFTSTTSEFIAITSIMPEFVAFTTPSSMWSDQPSHTNFSIRKMLTLLEELKQQGRQTQALLRQILNSQGAASKDTVQAELQDDVVFPLGSVDAMREMESLLCRQEIYRRVLAFLGTVGGESTRDTVRRTMRLVLSTHLAQQLNWIGKGNTKTAFSNTKIQLIITKAVRFNAASVKATDADIEAVMNDWLRYAKDRDGGRRRRAAANTQQENRDGDF